VADQAQSYATHRRWLPLWHFFALPVLLINVFVFGWNAIEYPGIGSAWGFVLALALLIGILASRNMPIRAQDRIIRLEERARLAQVLPPDLRGRINEFTPAQLVALRFAPDDEVSELARRCLSGDLKTNNDIKRAIKNWRADHFRV
jgi:hypothetical protein